MIRVTNMQDIKLKDISIDNCIVALTYIANSCRNEIELDRKIDAVEICDLIYRLTGLNAAQLNAYCMMNETKIGKE